jgi:fibronectin-binding autotransporter adhesin
VTQNSATSRLVLSGANTYTGATNVNSGTLAVNGSLASTSTTVSSGGTLQGSGSIGGSVTVQNGGIIATGNSIESMTIGSLELQAASTFAYEINNDAAAGVAADLTAVTGNLTLDLGHAAVLTISELGTGSWTLGEKLTLISYSGLWNGGLFNYGGTLADDSTIAFSGMDWSFNYNDTTAGTNYTGDLTGIRYVTMTAIPEPNVAALIGGLGTLALLRRRRN